MNTNTRSTTRRTSATLVTAVGGANLSSIEAGIMDWCNEAHEARAAGDTKTLDICRRELLTLLERYDATDGQGHPNPAWARANQRALAMSALGEVEQAIRLERAALRYADTPLRREISLGNLADRCVRIGRAHEAVEMFLAAWEETDGSVALLLTGAQALHAAGLFEDADRLVAAAVEIEPEPTESNELGAYLRYEDRLREMAPDLRTLRALFERWDAAGDRAATKGGAS
ncbi:MAG: hypothetical protein ACF8SC_03870 [Phycisphaerales bacterium JB037]